MKRIVDYCRFWVFAALIAVAAIAIGMPGVAQADWRGNNGGGHWHGGGVWHGNPGAWHGGSWYHGWHGDVFGWWWAVPGYDWYAFDAPMYPYPPYPGAPPPAPGPGPAPAPAAGLWYYCQNPAGYYPYVQQCGVSWMPVPPQGG